MAQYALAIVPADWDEKMPLAFSAAQYQDVYEKVEPGTELILFRAAPVNEVIGQAHVHNSFLKTSEWPQQNLGSIDASDPAQAYILPIEILFMLKGPIAPVPVERVREALNDPAFPAVGEFWRVLTSDEYDKLRDGWH